MTDNFDLKPERSRIAAVAEEVKTSKAATPGTQKRIPALINPKSVRQKEIREALEGSSAFELRPPGERDLDSALKEVLERGAARILVAGGDGTVRSAAEAVAGTAVELAIIPGGTLNHFAKHQNIPDDTEEAASVAANAQARPADAAWVNESLFLNTSSVGAYVKFVRVRERLEQLHIPYAIASFLAVIRTLVWLRTFRLTLEVDGARHEIDTPLVFIAVGERELRFPTLGDHKAGGQRGLHVIVVQGQGRARLVLWSAAVAARGADSASNAQASGIQSFVTERMRIDTRRAVVGVALDGEIKEIRDPLEYRYGQDVLRVVTAPNPLIADG